MKRALGIARVAATVCWMTATCAVGGSLAAAEYDGALNPALKPYKETTANLSGTLRAVGSDTLSSKMVYWAERFFQKYPETRLTLENTGSAAAPPALMDGTADIGPMSRAMTSDELAAFKEKFGYEPTRIVVAYDAVAVFVEKDNPVPALTLEQVKAIFGEGGALKTWGDLGLHGEWKSRPVVCFGRNDKSGTHDFFQKHALAGAPFGKVRIKPGNRAIVDSIARNEGGVGYASIAYRNVYVRPLALAAEADKPPVEPTFYNVAHEFYPLGRKLSLYINKKPGEALPPLLKEFLAFVLSREGQELVVREDFGPLSPEHQAAQLAKLE